MKMKAVAVQLALVLTLGLMSTAAFAQDYRGDRISTQGRITSITRDGDMYRVTLNHGGYTYMVPVATVQNRGLQVGDRVRLDGIVDGDLVTTDLVAMPGDARYIHDPEYRTVPYGSSGWLSATVVSTNRHMGYVTVRDDATGGIYKIDVRHMDRNRPINVWALRAGDHISVNGGWENRDTFNAVRIEY
jgi:hypothetical protein